MPPLTAIIDLGTNTFKLLVCTRQEGRLRVIYREELPVYLGRGGIEQGVIAPEAFERGMEALRTYLNTAHTHGATKVQGFGTSALRHARNGKEFAQRAKDELGIAISIIPGAEEAGLILEGVRQAVLLGDAPTLVMDIGGGSTEFILANASSSQWERSFELGVTRLRERFPCTDPMPLADEERIGAHLDDRLAPLYAQLDRHRPHLLVGSAGSFDTLATMITAAKGGSLDDAATTLHFDVDTFLELKDRLMHMDRQQRMAVPGLPEHRVDTIPYALVQIHRVLLAGEFHAMAWSRYALKEGAAARLMANP
jgi:exopolyphosphatase/guanosine-5'-triphosphate,3'-diphosphate pyrophosphatase